MASAQLHRPSDKTNHHHVQSTTTTHHKKTESTHHDNKNHSTSEHVKLTTHHKKTESTHHDKNSEHSFTDKVKEMAHSARKIFNNQDHQQGHAAVLNQAHKPASTGPGEKKKVRNADGHEKHCMPRMLDQMKKKKKGKASKYESDSGSSSDSDKEKARKKH